MNAAGLVLLRRFEGFAKVFPDRPNVAHAYPDPATGGDPWTIGYGFTKGVRRGDTMTREVADQRLFLEVAALEEEVLELCILPANENELAAMTCLAFNVGMGNFQKSTVLKAHNRGDHQSAARAFSLWNKAAGKVMTGLTRRRAAEAALYLQPVDGEVPGTMPQTIDPESRMVRSPIVGGASLAGGASAVGLVAEGARSVHDIRDSLGDLLPYALAAVAIGAAAWVIVSRFRQRRGGWA